MRANRYRKGLAVVLLAVSSEVARGGGDQWALNGSGSWSVASNWSQGVPTGGSAFIFGSDSINRTVVLDISATPQTLEVENTGTGSNLLSQAGNTLTINILEFGYFSNGSGYWNMSGGTVNIYNATPTGGSIGAIILGDGAGDKGTGTFSGGTINNLTGTMYVGNSGLGTFTQSGGTATLLSLILGTSSGGAGTYNMTGGMLNLTGAGGATLTVGSIGSGTFLLNGGTLSGGTVLLNPTGTFNGSSAGVVNSNFIQQGGTITGALKSAGTFTYVSGTFSGELINQGTLISSTNSFTAGNGIENDVQMTITPLLNYVANGIGWDNYGSLTLAGGSLLGSTVTNEPGGVLSGAGTIATSLSNSGVVNVAGVLNSTAGLTNYGQVNVPVGSALHVLQLNNNAAGIVEGGGAIFGPVANSSGGLIVANSSTSQLTLNNLQSNSAGGTIRVLQNSAINILNSFANSGLLDLEGPNAVFNGVTVNNVGTIKGNGDMNAVVSNSGIIRPAGELDLNGGGDSNNPSSGPGSVAGEIILDSGNTVVFSQGLGTNGGSIILTGGVFDNNNQPMTNSNVIQGAGTIRTGGLRNANLATIIFGAGSSSVIGSFTNVGTVSLPIGGGSLAGGSTVITGGGTATFFGAATLGAGGTFKVDTNSTAIFLGSLTGLSALSGSGTKYFGSTASGGAIVDNGASIVEGGASLAADYVRENSLSVTGNATITPSGSSSNYSRLSTLSITGGTVDLANNSLIVDSTPVGTIAGYIKSAYNSGSWNGGGLGSSSAQLNSTSVHPTALGYATASGIGVGSFAGQPVSGSTTLVKYTWSGDANLDGLVNLLDLNAIATDFGHSSQVWSQGDFNFDGTVNALDFNAVAMNFGEVLPVSAPPAEVGSPAGLTPLGAVVPEPASGAFLIAVFCFARRSKNKSKKMKIFLAARG